MAEVKKKKGESFESLMRRFTRRIQESGTILQARKIRYHNKDKSKNAERTAAIRRTEIGERREYMLKTGKMKEEDFQRRRRR